jgi:endonuclease/exonuclease/phosphatase family metal-dependent hydrolase
MKVLSWNVQWCLGVDGRVDPARIVAEARAFADFDVLCLQEVACNFPALAGSAGEDQFAAIAAVLPGFTALRASPSTRPRPTAAGAPSAT